MQNSESTITGLKREKNTLLLSSAVLILSLIYYLSYAHYGLILSDAGMIVLAAEKFLKGQVFYKDFSTLYTPGIYLYTATAFKIFGISLKSATIGWGIVRALNCLLIYLIGSEFLSRRWALILPLLLWFVPGSLHKGFFIFFVLLSILVLLKVLSSKSRTFYFFSGMLAGIIVLFRVDLCGFYVMTFTGIEFIKIYQRDKKMFGMLEFSTPAKNMITFGSGSLISVAPFALYLNSNGALAEAYRQTTEYTSAIKSVWFFLPPLESLFSFDIMAMYKYIGLTLPFIFYFAVFILIITVIASRSFVNEDRKLIIVFLFGCMTLNQAIVYPGISRISLILPPVLIADIYLVKRFLGGFSKGWSSIHSRVFKYILVGLNVLLFVYIATSCTLSDPYINGSVFMRALNKTYLDDPRLKVYTEAKYADEFNEVTDAIRTLTHEDEYIFTFPGNSQMFHFVTGRKSLDKYGMIPEYLKSEDRQRKVINLLKQKNVRLIIANLGNKQIRDEWAPILDRYIMEHYEPVQTVNAFTLLFRK